jgi:hypothetical protein
MECPKRRSKLALSKNKLAYHKLPMQRLIYALCQPEVPPDARRVIH